MTAPAVCALCQGDGWAVVPGDEEFGWQWVETPCPGCCCSTCGEPTSTPPLCEVHQRENDDREAADD